MKCSDVQRELLQVMDCGGQLSASVAKHLDGCQACDDFQAALDCLVPADMPAPSAELDARVLEAARREGRDGADSRPASRGWKLIFPRFRWAAAAAALALLLLLAGVMRDPVPSSSPSPARVPDASQVWGEGSGQGEAETVSLEEELLLLEARLATALAADGGAGATTEALDASAAEMSDSLLRLEAQLLYIEEAI